MLLQWHIIAVFTFSSWRVSVAMLMECVPCGQQDLDDSFLQHIFNRHLCEAQQHDDGGVSFKQGFKNYATGMLFGNVRLLGIS